MSLLEPSVPQPVPPVVGEGPKRTLSVRALGLALNAWALVSPRAAGRWCHRAYFKSWRPPLSRDEQELLRSGDPLAIPWRSPTQAPYPCDGELRGWTWGRGPAILLVHGWHGRAARLAASFVPSLVPAGFRVIAVDLPGHGDSPGRASDLLSFSEAVRAIAAHTAIDAIVAHSAGVAASIMALARGVGCRAFVGVAAAIWLEGFPETFCLTLGASSRLRTEFWRQLHATFPAPLWQQWAPLTEAPSLSAPALLVHDRTDREMHWTGTVALARQWPGARVLLTDGFGHRRIVKAKEVVESAVRFLAEALPAGGRAA